MGTRSKIIAAALTGTVAATAITTTLLPTTPAHAEYVVDFNVGDYSVWDGVTYTFDWYESPEEIDGVTTYTIATASDLAGFAVVTNNLSSTEFSEITANVPEQYIALNDTFEGAVVKLAGNIDLADFAWLPIAYPWATANLTARYAITTPEGTVVHYNGVDYIPDDTVDPWVGDENGDPISTRYWEYPESELRFRDLMVEPMHEWEQVENILPEWKGSLGPSKWMPLYWTKGNAELARMYNVVLAGQEMINKDYTRDIVTNYGLKDIKG